MSAYNVKINGLVVAHDTLRIVESFDLFTAYAEARLHNNPVGCKVEIAGTEMEVVKMALGPNMTYDCLFWPTSTLNYLKASWGNLQGRMNHHTMFQDPDLHGMTVGPDLTYDVVTNAPTDPVYYCMPPMNFVEFINYVVDLVNVPGGGGTVFTIDFSGHMRFWDMKYAFDTDPWDLVWGNRSQVNSDYSYILAHSTMFEYSETAAGKGINGSQMYIEKFNGMNRERSFGMMEQPLFNDKAYGNYEVRIRNHYYRRFYTCMRRTYLNLDNTSQDIHIGAIGKDKSSGNDNLDMFMVWGFDMRFGPNGGTTEMVGVSPEAQPNFK